MLTDAQLTEIRAAAHEGGLLLDEKVPEWAGRVNPATLNMWLTTRCVVGQSMPNPRFTFGLTAYSAKLRLLGTSKDDAPRYGFNLWTPSSAEAWNVLADAWRVEIANRLTTPVPVNVEETLALAV